MDPAVKPRNDTDKA
ncbi:hypothetical protein ACFLK8_00935 [Rickettsia sibirica subsp. sibirica BJ-90]